MRALLRRVALALAAVLVFGPGLPAGAARAADTLGVVLLHGLQSGPNQFSELSDALAQAGYKVEVPELCWSRQRVYDRTFTDCMGDVDAAIGRLKTAGVTAIVVGGQSLGGNAAIYYGATHDGLAGIVGLAPAGDAERGLQSPELSASLSRAATMADQGQGDARADFTELNTNAQGTVSFTVTTTARIYLSFHGAGSAASLAANAARLKAPLLWVAGTRDPTQRDEPGAGFAKAPANPLNRFVKVEANHLSTPNAARDAVIAWLGALPKP